MGVVRCCARQGPSRCRGRCGAAIRCRTAWEGSQGAGEGHRASLRRRPGVDQENSPLARCWRCRSADLGCHSLLRWRTRPGSVHTGCCRTGRWARCCWRCRSHRWTRGKGSGLPPRCHGLLLVCCCARPRGAAAWIAARARQDEGEGLLELPCCQGRKGRPVNRGRPV